MSVHNVVEEINASASTTTAAFSGAVTATYMTASGSVTSLGPVTASGAITSSSPSAGVGYATGAGGAVTQLTNRTTGVTLNTICGTITTHTASLAAESAAEFVVTNSRVAIGDVVVVCEQSGSNGGNTNVHVTGTAAGSFNISVANNNAAAGTAETGAILINFAVIKSVTA